ncbi:DUF4331 domain-containing protein [Gilvimarinus agarilyticus]|uniref:DUF4331 family protein n=1 Tax=Gilvimarinus sp. 2_MG-2023 TaxID=3062666 RepID=UPI001C07F0AA|nr:DUF4331 family protein [Gilvimarinus sp. 2_MG-2023]MBU2886027.1 DUF4331 domain-containing protein [Gilvimarinus agarilyticus]MDO6570773.1 DUF4331 family protein [Gilvimarinus sp. 2_MG-2023]
MIKLPLIKIFASLILLLLLQGAAASDHADPVFNQQPTRSLSGLFAFIDNNDLIIILTTHPGLNHPLPIHHLHEQTYRVHLDLTSKVSFDNPQQRMRYGGSINRPKHIKESATLAFSLNENAELVKFKPQGALQETDNIRVFTGVRDDPFIFPKFFGTNVVAMVTAIPLDAFPKQQKDFVLWGDIIRKGKKIDHVGRSNRTMQPRLDFLNTLEPYEHLEAINKKHNDPGLVDKVLMSKLAPLFAIRDYDKFPDVMIFSRHHKAGFPNGRLLTDDVADLTCQLGDCLLWELSYGDVRTWNWPRKNTNDKPFLPHFPYLAKPW